MGTDDLRKKLELHADAISALADLTPRDRAVMAMISRHWERMQELLHEIVSVRELEDAAIHSIRERASQATVSEIVEPRGAVNPRIRRTRNGAGALVGAGRWQFPADAATYCDAVNHDGDSHWCEHGHPDCALWNRGPCSDEVASTVDDLDDIED